MKTYSLFDKPLKVYGVPFFEENKKLTRLPDGLIEKLPRLELIGRRCPGGRVAFQTDSATLTVRVTLKTLRVDAGMSLYSGQAAHVMVGERENARLLGLVNPPDYQTKAFEKTFSKSSELEQITIHFPRNEQLENIEISVEDGATVTEPTPYRHEKPVVFYGSSITEGCCSGSPINSYSAMLSRWLDFDYYNLGFSASARGELAVADYINTLDMSVFVYDYDHNAPTLQHLADTHEPFFKRIRQVHPELPIVIMTRPAAHYTEGMAERREVIKATYQAALDAGDNNVYFIDGEAFYGETDRELCSADNCHPNDLGFFRMASVIRPVLERILD